MKTLVKIEELFLFILSILFFRELSYPWWLYPALFLVPDLSMIGYMHSTKTGAFTYNLVHHRALSISIMAAGFYLQNELTMLIGIMLFAHSSLDRVFDYGFKYADDFKHTHLNA